MREEDEEVIDWRKRIRVEGEGGGGVYDDDKLGLSYLILVDLSFLLFVEFRILVGGGFLVLLIFRN